MKLIWDHLTSRVIERRPELPEEALTMRGVWTSEYILRVTPQSSPLHLRYVIVQTQKLGCCYLQAADPLPGLSEALITRKNALDHVVLPRRVGPPDAMQIAALDAVYGSIIGDPKVSYVILGSNVEKAPKRAHIVCRPAIKLLESRPLKHKTPRIVNVGVIGDFLYYLRERRPDISVTATDFYDFVLGDKVHDVTVMHGGTTPQLVAEADVAIITGMTLQTDTLDEILQTALANETRIVMFAQTGAHFAEEYCGLGIDVVVSEPFPFYLSADGATELRLYRSPATQSEVLDRNS